MAATRIGPERLLYGSDYPLTRRDAVIALAAEMEEGLRELLGEESRIEGVHICNEYEKVTRNVTSILECWLKDLPL